jgi:hypothetical protein
MLAMNLGDSESPAPALRSRGLTDQNQAVNLVNQRTRAQISKQISMTPHKPAKFTNFSAAVLSDHESSTSSDEDIEVTGITLDEGETLDESPKSGSSFRSRFSRQSSARRVQSHTGVEPNKALPKRETSPFKRFPHLTGK